ncbi:MAG: hypothetical protein OXN17_08715 [Candidatus Poribacteria bacterium]|nr:hypothetical protein [Candidatus Poribacteria bacterium]
MRFKLILGHLLFAGLCVCLTSGELWLGSALAFNTNRIVFTFWKHGDGEVYVMDADGRNRENLTNHPGYDFDPDWSPDGTKIAFGSGRNDVFQIYVMDADGENQMRLTDGPRQKREPDWSPDGSKIAFTVDDGVSHIGVMDADGKNRVRLENRASEPSWSPDGRQIAFATSRNGDHEIFVIGADGQGLERVKHGLRGHSPSFSPDGRRIAYYESHEGFRHIHSVDTDGKNRVRLTHNQGHHSHPTWSPDGQMIAYVAYKDLFFGDATIHLMTADGKYLKQLSRIRDGIDFQPDFSPVGLAVSHSSKTATIWGKIKIPFGQ